MILYIGIDPGVTGAVSIIYPSGKVKLIDAPTLQGSGTRREFDTYAMAELLGGFRGHDCFVCIEKAQAMPPRGADGERRGQGAVGMFNYGKGVGLWLGMIAAFKLPFMEVHPATWKAALMKGMPKSKDASKIVAERLFPGVSEHLQRVKDHGRADALLIAAYGRQTWRPEQIAREPGE